jgi:predicted dehydrogenase
MNEGKLKAAVLGLNEQGLLMLEAASKIDYFEIFAVADKDTAIAENTAEQYQCEGYDDYRQLVTAVDSRLRSGKSETGENSVDTGCLLVAAPMHTCDEYVRMAAKKKINILKLPPAARNFEEAAELVHLAEEQDIKFAVGNVSRFAKSFNKLCTFIREGQIEHVFLITAFCNVGEQQHPEWQNDPELAGGGALLHNCYKIIDQVILNLGTPEQVYSLNTNAAADKQQRHYLTEDTAVVTMKFSDTLSGNLTATRRSGTGPKEEFVKIYGKDKILTVTNAHIIVYDGNSQKSKKTKYDDDEQARYKAMLENFALSTLQPGEHKLVSSGRENLTNMAVIDTAYLSARTAAPEEPAKILQMAQIEPKEV